MTRNDWLDSSTANVVQSLLADLRRFDEGGLTMEDIREKFTSTVRFSLDSCYDTGFSDGMYSLADEEGEGDEIELDLDTLRQIGEEEGEDDEED